jgi:hypothetical protein
MIEGSTQNVQKNPGYEGGRRFISKSKNRAPPPLQKNPEYDTLYQSNFPRGDLS